jgi:hypothetical protein
MGASLSKERKLLEYGGARVQVVEADAESTGAFGPDPLDPAYRHAAAEVGLRQAARVLQLFQEQDFLSPARG